MNTTQDRRENVAIQYEVIDSAELAKRWGLPETWIRDQVRRRAIDPIPCVRLGKYIRFEWGSPELQAWFGRRRTRSKQSS